MLFLCVPSPDCNARPHQTLPTLWKMFSEFGSPLSISPELCGKKQPQGFCVLHDGSNDGQCVICESSSVMWVESTNFTWHVFLKTFSTWQWKSVVKWKWKGQNNYSGTNNMPFLTRYIYVIYRSGGPYGKKLCPRSWVWPGPTYKCSPVNNMFIFFSCSKLASQITNGFVYAALVIQWACVLSTNDL